VPAGVLERHLHLKPSLGRVPVVRRLAAHRPMTAVAEAALLLAELIKPDCAIRKPAAGHHRLARARSTKGLGSACISTRLRACRSEPR
jgi:hypothetical protein